MEAKSIYAKNAVGCFWNHHFVGADDVVLLAPSPSALRHMVDTCSHFASSHSLVFNSTKHSLLDLLGVVLVIKLRFHS